MRASRSNRTAGHARRSTIGGSGRTGALLAAGGVAALGAAATIVGAGPAGASSADRAHAQVELGRRLFFDPSVSQGARFSCSSCHDPEHGFSDPRRFSEDETGVSKRHSQPVTDLAGRGFHWDGEFDTVRQLLVTRLAPKRDATRALLGLIRERFDAAVAAAGRPPGGNGSPVGDDEPDRSEFNRRTGELAARETPPYYGPVTTGVPEVTAIAERLNQDGRYASLLAAATGRREAAHDDVIDAIRAYLATLRTSENAYDRHLQGEKDALSAEAARGLALFEGKAGCASCHTTGLGLDGARLTDGKFHNTGVAFRNLKLAFGRPVTVDGGLGAQSFLPRDLGKFKTPSLRDVERRPPYMHDGGLETLEDVVDYYARGGTANGRIDAHVKPFDLTAGEKADLVAFLRSLTGAERAGLADPPAHLLRETTVRVVNLQGNPVKGLTISVTGAGDRFRGTQRPEGAQLVTTDNAGVVRFPFPPSTHARLECGTHELGLSRLLPDCAERADLIATPRDKVSLRVVFRTDAIPRRLEAVRTGAVRTEAADLSAATDFTWVRNVGRREALYVAAAPEKGRTVRVQLFADQKALHDASDVWELDLSGGASETIDLREYVPPVAPERPPARAGGGMPEPRPPSPEPPRGPVTPSPRNPGETGARAPGAAPPRTPGSK